MGTLLRVLILTLLVFPALGLVARFAGAAEWSAWAFRQAPSFLTAPAELERQARENADRQRLWQTGRVIRAGGMEVVLPAGNRDETVWQDGITRTRTLLGDLLPGSPPLPRIELRPMEGVLGRFDNFRALVIDPDGDEPIRTLAHELTHWYLLWALIPGFPIDCPRWLNEGLAEECSGRLMDDAARWQAHALLRERDLVPLDVVSPAFSWEGWAVEWPAREAAALLLERFGRSGLLAVVGGLRVARPFRSVFQIVTGEPVSVFETQWRDRLRSRRVIEQMEVGEVRRRLIWLAEHRPLAELHPLLRDLPDSFLGTPSPYPLPQPTGGEGLGNVGNAHPPISLAQPVGGKGSGTVGCASTPDLRLQAAGGEGERFREKVLALARLQEARRCLDRGQTREGLGWLRDVPSHLPEVAALHAGLVAKARQDAGLVRGSGNPLPGRSWFAWVLAVLLSWGLVAGYRRLRQALIPGLLERWRLAPGGEGGFRWLVVGVAGLGGAWFLRFLVVAMIPYLGWGPLSDLSRILLSEVVVIFWWLGLAWQLRRWDRGPAGGGGEGPAGSAASGTVSPESEANRSAPVSLSEWLLVAATGFLPPLIMAARQGWQPSGIPLSETGLAVAVAAAGSGAFGLAFWQAARRWQRQAGGGQRWGPALIYAGFRGGLAGDPWGSLYALALGWRLAGWLGRSGRLWAPVAGDLLGCLPALLLTASWFPAVDPLGGQWSAGPGSCPFWLGVALLLWFWPAAVPVTPPGGKGQETI